MILISVLRSSIFFIVFGLTTVFYGLFGATVARFIPARTEQRILLGWNWTIIHAARWICGVRYRIHGELPTPTEPYVIMAKHQSAWETYFLQWAVAPTSTILKRELLNVPFFGMGLARFEPIAIDRSNPIQALKQVKSEGIKRLQAGRNVLIFPEGTRIPPGQKGKYARSGSDIAIAANTPIIPVAHNAGEVWVNKHWIKAPGLIDVYIGQPITTEGKSSKQVTQEVEDWIEHHCELIRSDVA